MSPSAFPDDSRSNVETFSPAPTAGRRSVRILIADDHELVRTAFACLLERLGYVVVAQASNGQEAITLWHQFRPDVSILDLRMPVLDGIGAINAIRALDPQARTVVLSTFDGDDQVSRAMRAGASAYLLKGISPDMLCTCIDSVHDGARYLAPELAQRLAIHSSGPSPTHRELEVLSGVAQGLCNKRIARDLGIEEGTVKAHLKSILRKLEASSRTQAASIAIRRGLVEV